MNKRFMLVLALLLVAALVLSGCGFGYDSYTLDCNGIALFNTEGEAYYLNYDSDNDSNPDSQEAWVYGVDGAGNVLVDASYRIDPDGMMWNGVDEYVAWTQPPQANPVTFQIIVKANGYLTDDRVIEEIVADVNESCETPAEPAESSAPPVMPSFQDGRINRYDAGAPVVVYPASYGARGMGLHIYAVQPDSTGTLLMEVTPEQLAAVSGDWALVAANADNTVQVFKYLDGWQINATADQGKTYVVMFDGLSAGEAVDSYTTDPVQ